MKAVFPIIYVILLAVSAFDNAARQKRRYFIVNIVAIAVAVLNLLYYAVGYTTVSDENADNAVFNAQIERPTAGNMSDDFMPYYSLCYYKHPVSYLNENKAVALELTSKYTLENSLFGQNRPVRGYTNLLFHRSVYENVTLENLVKKARDENKQYVVFMTPTGVDSEYDYTDEGAVFVYDMSKATADS